MTFVGVIPARGGSKGIPKKNIALCDGRPLLAYTAMAARTCDRLSRVILSTDCNEIAEAGRSLGLDVPFLRPPELARDDTMMIDVLQHLLVWLDRNGGAPDAMVLLQPTSPLRNERHVREAIDHFRNSDALTLVSVVAVPHQFNPTSVMEIQGGWLAPWLKQETLVLRRQDKPVVYARNGPAVLIVRSELIRAGKLYGDRTAAYVMSASDSIDIDGPEELRLAEVILRARREGLQI
jgi:CMP-N,N'-diacetyllegionaminic acid synthase